MTDSERRTGGGAPGHKRDRGLAAARRRFRSFLAETGSTTVEFATIAPLFFIWVFVILQMCLLLFMSQVLQTATVKAGRQYMTGNATTVATPAAFEPLVCANLPSFFNCTNLVVNLQTASSASALAANDETPLTYQDPCTTTAGVTTCTPEVCSGATCSPGTVTASAPEQFAILQVFYPAPLIGNGFGFGNILVGTTVFQVEPYPTTSS
jgi:Flp pilus assembly protein TadG